MAEVTTKKDGAAKLEEANAKLAENATALNEANAKVAKLEKAAASHEDEINKLEIAAEKERDALIAQHEKELKEAKEASGNAADIGSEEFKQERAKKMKDLYTKGTPSMSTQAIADKFDVEISVAKEAIFGVPEAQEVVNAKLDKNGDAKEVTL